MLGNPKLRKASSLGMAAMGAFTLIAPKKAAVVGDKLSLAPRYEGVKEADLDPRDWYVDATRASGAGMLAAGLTGFLLAVRDDTATAVEDDEADDADDESTDDDTEELDGVDVIETSADASDDPVEIDLDDVDSDDD